MSDIRKEDVKAIRTLAYEMFPGPDKMRRPPAHALGSMLHIIDYANTYHATRDLHDLMYEWYRGHGEREIARMSATAPEPPS